MRHALLQSVLVSALASCLALTGCQSLTSAGSAAHIRLIHLSVDAQPVDLYQGSSVVAYNLSFGTVTSYIPVAPGRSTIAVDLAGTRQLLASTEGTFAAGASYTILLNGAPGTSIARPSILADRAPSLEGRLTPAPAGPSLRLIHQASATEAVDVYLIPSGHPLAAATPFATNLAPGATTAYLPAPVCTCTVILLPAGVRPSTASRAFAGTQVDLSGTATHTLLLLEAPAATGSRIISVTDADTSQ